MTGHASFTHLKHKINPDQMGHCFNERYLVRCLEKIQTDPIEGGLKCELYSIR
jgi:hypothetical protein